MTAAMHYRKRDVLDFIERHIRRRRSEQASTIIAAEPAAALVRISLRRMAALSLPGQLDPVS